MTRDSYSALQSKIEKEILKLQKQAEALRAKQRAPIIRAIIRDMREYQITPEEIIAAFNSKTGKTPKSSQAPIKKAVTPKYRDPNTGSTWTGRGKPPRWITEAETSGGSRDQFLIENARKV
ncbi:MAG: H-NS histone family protein [Alcaligenaceae bacterium]|nr:H-NS histone family protein [Alcaligenaceae bacterium]